MSVGMEITIDKLGRIVISKGYREFYHIDKEDYWYTGWIADYKSKI